MDDLSRDPVPPAGRRLTLSGSNRVLAGVCGGIGDYLGIDATLVRLVTVLLALFGGSGLVLYLAAWVLMPAPDGGPPLAQGWLSR